MPQSIFKLTGTLVYVMVDEPRDCYDKEKGQEWKASIVVDEEQADAFNDEYPKQPAKKVKTIDFEREFKIPAPDPEARSQYVITLKLNTKLGNGNPVPEQYQPQVLLQKEDGTRETITKSILVANGSKGAISISHYDGKMGSVARLKNILVTDLIPYEKTSGGAGYEAGDEFGEGPKPKATKEQPKTEAKPAPKKAAPKQEEADDESPF